jgi:hypothetical protein
MSERGSFITEYIYCNKCFEACKQILLGNTKWLNSLQIHEFPIIAGKIGGLYCGEEFVDMEHTYIPKIQELMCDFHKIRICVHSDGNGSIIYEIDKHNVKEVWLNEVEDDTSN